MPITRIAYLFGRYFDKTASAEERAEFMSLLTVPEHQAEIQALMEAHWEAFPEGEIFFKPEQSEAMLSAALSADSGRTLGVSDAGGTLGTSGPGRTLGTSDPAPASPRVAGPLRRLAYLMAASALLLVVGAGLWWQGRNKAGVRLPAGPLAAKVDSIKPGNNKAVLILEDGSKVQLDSLSKGQLATQGGTEVIQQGGGRVAYVAGEGGPRAQDADTQQTVTYNTIVTPRGGQYKITLPDGTKVWLNAASSLRFPTAFTGKSREVNLSGEGYFEVAQDAGHPFRVKVNQTNVDVLGTRFDIMAYSDEPTMNTSLLQGAVRVEDGGQQALPRPGEEVIFNPGTLTMKVAPVDTDQAVAWKNGLFLFEGVTLDKVMRQLARWYDVKFSIEGNIAYHYSGGFSRNAQLYDVLRTLELGVRARFEQEGELIKIKPMP
jgi:transmembrane sensor